MYAAKADPSTIRYSLCPQTRMMSVCLHAAFRRVALQDAPAYEPGLRSPGSEWDMDAMEASPMRCPPAPMHMCRYEPAPELVQPQQQTGGDPKWDNIYGQMQLLLRMGGRC